MTLHCIKGTLDANQPLLVSVLIAWKEYHRNLFILNCFSQYIEIKKIYCAFKFKLLSELNLPLMQAARGGNGLVCGCSRRIILEEFCILCKSFYVAGVEFLHVITRGNIQKWEAGVYSFRHQRNVYKKTKGYFFRCFTLI